MFVGIDIVSIPRMKKIIGDINLKKSKGVLSSIFSKNEIKKCSSLKNPYKYYAVRFAGKEALLKALGTGLSRGILFSDMEFLNYEKGIPFVKCHGETKKELMKKRIKKINVSFSHSRENAVAVVILEN